MSATDKHGPRAVDYDTVCTHARVCTLYNKRILVEHVMLAASHATRIVKGSLVSVITLYGGGFFFSYKRRTNSCTRRGVAL